MPARTESNNAKVSRSLVTTLAIAFVILSVIPLLGVSGLLGYFDFRDQQKVLFYRQQLIAADAAREVSGFVEQIFSALEAGARIGQVSDREQQRLILEKLLGFEDALREVVLVDKAGQEIVRASRRSSIASSNLLNLTESDLSAQLHQDQRFISAVYFDQDTNEPLVSMAVPIKDVFGEFQGTLVAEVNLKFMWDLVDHLQVEETGVAYVVDKQGKLIAFGDTERVLKGENLGQLAEVAKFINDQSEDERELYSIGINNSPVIAAYVPLGTPDWAVITEIPVTEAYQSVIRSLVITLGIVLVAAGLAGVVGVYLSRRLAAPLRNLTETATRIAGGELELVAPVEGAVEVGQLATAFNHMTSQLRELIDSLEQRVANRTQRLELVATLSERLTAILDLEELLQELVNQIKNKFAYYHVQVYLIDDTRQNLIMIAGADQAGERMKAQNYRLPLNAPTSLVARAARTGQIINIDNVYETEDWLPNLLLPDTCSEMAVPIILEGQVVGVLDVQEDELAGLDEGDANLLRSLASQMAVAIRNARLFAEVEMALAQARAAQEKYVEQAWQQRKDKMQKLEHLHVRKVTASSLPEAALIEAKQLALVQNQPALVRLNGIETPSTSLVAPITLSGKTIGVLQAHRLVSAGDEGAETRTWTDEDLAVVETVLDQVAQAAENLRLFEETRERAGREQTIREITTKLRAAPNLDTLLETAARELGQRLGVRHTVLELGIESDIRQPISDINKRTNDQ